MARLQVKLKSSNCAGSQAPSIIVIQNQTEARHFGRDAEIVSVHPPCLYPGSEAILAAISADETSALPGGSERLRVKRVLTGLSKLGAQDEGEDQITGELAMALSELLEQQVDIAIVILQGSVFDQSKPNNI